MKKLYSVLIFFSFAVLAQAQTLSDTVGVYYERATGVNLIGANAGGYFFGTGYYHNTVGFDTTFRLSDKIAQHFSTVGTADVSEVLVWWGAAAFNQTPDTVAVGIYNVGADSMPTTSLGAAQLPVADIIPSATTTVFTSVIFPTPVAVTGDFAVVLDYTNVDDTIGLVNSADGSGFGEKRTRIFVDALLGGGWKRLGAILQANADVDLMIVPVVQYTLGMAAVEAGAFSVSLFPSPTADLITLSFDMKQFGDAAVNVFDLSGRSYYSSVETLHAGLNAVSLDVRNFSAGHYYVTTSVNGASVTGKFSVVK